jgi:K(+)-stimulated pyrophosphate-energized sodium pump
VLAFSIIIATTVEESIGQFQTTGPFLLGALTSIISGYIGMQIAVRANIRTAKQATISLNDAFNVAFRGGMVLGFVLVGLALLTLHLLCVFYIHNMDSFFGGHD